MKVEQIAPRKAPGRVKALKPDIMGISAITDEARRMHDLADLIRIFLRRALIR